MDSSHTLPTGVKESATRAKPSHTAMLQLPNILARCTVSRRAIVLLPAGRLQNKTELVRCSPLVTLGLRLRHPRPGSRSRCVELPCHAFWIGGPSHAANSMRQLTKYGHRDMHDVRAAGDGRSMPSNGRTDGKLRNAKHFSFARKISELSEATFVLCT